MVIKGLNFNDEIKTKHQKCYATAKKRKNIS